PRMGSRPRLGRLPGLPHLVPGPAAARGDDGLLRRGVVPEVHPVPDREPGAHARRRAARRRRSGDAAVAGRRVARGHGGDVDLRTRPGSAVPGPERVPVLARALRTARGAATSMTAVVEFTLDGRRVEAPEGELLVHAAARHGVFIPTLCHDDKLAPYGGCRMCVVAVEGSPRPLPACATR